MRSLNYTDEPMQSTSMRASHSSSSRGLVNLTLPTPRIQEFHGVLWSFNSNGGPIKR